jgi:hypothetical protein
MAPARQFLLSGRRDARFHQQPPLVMREPRGFHCFLHVHPKDGDVVKNLDERLGLRVAAWRGEGYGKRIPLQY